MSLRFLDHAQRELDRGRRLQASEKAWGAVAHQLTAIAIERGWNYGTHYGFTQMAEYLRQETDNPDIATLFQAAEAAHGNFYQNHHGPEFIQDSINNSKVLVSMLEDIRQNTPAPVTIRTRAEQGRVKALTGGFHAIGETGVFIGHNRLRSRQERYARAVRTPSSEDDD